MLATGPLALSNTGVKGHSSRPLPPAQTQQRRYYTALDFPHADLTCILYRTSLFLRSHPPLWMASYDSSSKGVIRPPQTCLAYLMGNQDHPPQLAKPPSSRSAGPAHLLLLFRFIVIPRLAGSLLEFHFPSQHTANGQHPNKRPGCDRVGQASLQGS
jgi:hypothetical protein